MRGCQNYVPLLSPRIQVPYYTKDSKIRDHNFDNHSYELTSWVLYMEQVRSLFKGSFGGTIWLFPQNCGLGCGRPYIMDSRAILRMTRFCRGLIAKLFVTYPCCVILMYKFLNSNPAERTETFPNRMCRWLKIVSSSERQDVHRAKCNEVPEHDSRHHLLWSPKPVGSYSFFG